MNTYLPVHYELKENVFLELSCSIVSTYLSTSQRDPENAKLQLKENILNAAACLPCELDLLLYKKIYELLAFFSQETEKKYAVSLIPFLSLTSTGKVGEKSVTVATGDPALFFSKQFPVQSYLALLTPSIIATLDIEKNYVDVHYSPFCFVEYCLEKMSK